MAWGRPKQEEQCSQLRYKPIDLQSAKGQDMNLPALINQTLDSQKAKDLMSS